MARQESQSKALYYPTPLEPVVDLIATWFTKTDYPVRLADPCVGEGLALRRLADRINAPKVETWGVEVSYSRAEKAEKIIDIVLPVSLNIANWDSRSVSLAFDNPPYDWSESVDSNNKRLRMEEVFLTKTTEKLVPGGVHVYIVPQWLLAREGVARHWCGWYERWAAFRFPDPEYDAFGQVVLMGQRRAKYHVVTKLEGENFVALGAKDYELPILRAGATDAGYYTLPKAPAFSKFAYSLFDNNLVAAAVKKTNHLDTRDWERVSYVRPLGAPIKPIVQLKIGHLSMLISGGELGIVEMDTEDGRALVKGTLRKVIDHHSEDIVNQDGHVTGQKIEEQERLQSVISLLNAGGKLEMLNGTQQVADFITKYAAPLADAVLDHNHPFYNWQPTQHEWNQAGKAAMGLPPLPGRQERGLFDVQKHFAIASARFQTQGNRWMGGHGWKHVVMNCEMGFGKTPTAVANLEQLDKWPALVMCPGHMVFKWRTQLEAASDVSNPIHARVITRPVREGAAWLHTDVMPILANYQASMDDDKRWQVEPLGDKDTGGRRRLTIKVESRAAVITIKDREGHELSQQVSNLRLGLMNALTTRVSVRENVVPVIKQMTNDGFTIEFMDRDEYTMADFYDDSTFGRLGKKPVAVVSFEPAKYGAGMRALDLKWRYFNMYSVEQERVAKVQAPVCPGCGKPLGVTLDPEVLINFHGPTWHTENELEQDEDSGNFKMTFEDKMPEICPHYDEHGIKGDDGLPVMQDGQPLMVRRYCKTRLYEMSRWRREGLSRLIQRKYPHWFKCYIADEVHESKSADTDIGTADGRFISSIEHSLALTGTLFGGTASSLFYLFFRRNPEVRRNYQYKDGRSTWVDHFGLWRYRWTEKPDDDRYVQRGRSSGVKRWDTKPPQEMPGISPAVVRYLLPITLFGKITDLGYTLPPLYDHVETMEMAEDQGRQYRDVDKELLDQAIELIITKHDSSMLTTWFTTVRYRPMSGFRREFAMWRDNPILEMGPVVIDGGTLPKEQRMAEIIKENTNLGRKTLVFVEQTGTRDIRDRLVQIVNELAPMVNIQTLSAGEVKPAKREMWIRRNAPAMDAMLVNAGLVKTGLDLVMFSDIIFYEINSSLYTVWQAMRRVWRLGQKQTVRTTFLAYNATMEERLLDRMGKKMKAAMLLYGDNAAGALIESDGEDDIAREIIRNALAGKTIENAGDINGKSLFGSGEEHAVIVSNSPMGSVLAATPPMVILTPSEPEPQLELFSLGEVSQLSMFGDMLAVPVSPKKRRR